MTVTGINYIFMVVSSITDRITEAEISLTGNDPVITTTARESYETKIKKYKLSEEDAARYISLIEKYNLAETAGKENPVPEASDGNSSNV